MLNSHRPLRALVESQAEDEGLWFETETAPEAYLQQELRKLHAHVEAFLDELFPADLGLTPSPSRED